MLIRHILLLGAVFGLLWQSVAYASPPCAEMQQQQAVAMAGMADCMDSDKQSSDHSPPCSDMSAGCIVMIGCASLVSLDVFPASVSVPNNAALAFSCAASPMLLGRSIAPIPDPPSILG